MRVNHESAVEEQFMLRPPRRHELDAEIQSRNSIFLQTRRFYGDAHEVRKSDARRDGHDRQDERETRR